jgi:hypothetical protein
MQLRAIFVWWALPCLLSAQIAITGKVVDETGAAIEGARVELRAAGGPPVSASSDRAGSFKVTLPADGEIAIRAERLGFYLYQGKPRRFEPGPGELTIVMNHLQEFSDHIDVVYSPPAIDPAQPSDKKELDNTEILTVPYPAPHDYRNALPMFDGVVQDNAGRAHFNGAQQNQTNYMLDGFNVSDPVTGRLEARVNIESIQAMEVQTSRFSAENGRGSAGVMDLKTKMGDDRYRFAGTNFIPGISSLGGWHLNKWTPRLEVSGPFARGRAWFHNGFDMFYDADTIRELPRGENRTHGITTSNLSRFQVNLRPSAILTGSFLMNYADTNRAGLSFLNPIEATTDRSQTLYMSTARIQKYFSGGALLDGGYADTRGIMSNVPQGTELYQITPEGNRGNYFTGFDRHFFRQQWNSNLYLPVVRWSGEHRLKVGVDFEREAFHQKVMRHDYAVLRDDRSVARYVTFEGSPFQARKNFEGSYYAQDAWTPRDGLLIEGGVRVDWNEIVRDPQVAPRLAFAWAPKRLGGTKFSAGWGMYYDSITLDMISREQEQTSLATFYPRAAPAIGPVATAFLVNDRALRAPFAQTLSFAVEHKLPRGYYLRSGVMQRLGRRGLVFVPQPAEDDPASIAALYELANARRTSYRAFEVSLRHTFAARYEWFVGYTRSSSRSNTAVDYNLENPVFAPQAPGPFPWDTPNRVHMWGWAPLPNRVLPPFLRFVTRNTTMAYLVEYRTGFPFGVVSEESFLVGGPNSSRFPDYFNINLHLERQFRALHYLWAWRFGFTNLTNNGNPNAVNNVLGTPQFLTYQRGQARAFTVRLRLLGRK